ncbi:hypothetical protein [Ruficoccus sp. ZRK36]|uniref:hypothetical protein n=1 Tax=Ruficoccus sp. ZRK36 TaxID=2866311 RepID=UPI001C735879|nr:hypothetical protein [Ruficoccus sp. ZRK36]QYY35928.1 hypothetical protein K0V07_00295 [Ruficoccus sp. ZRK36]
MMEREAAVGLRVFCAFIVCTVGLLTGCTSTSISSYRDPAYAQTSYSSFVIVAGLPRVSAQGYLESELARLLSERGIDAIRGVDILPPTREYDPESITQALRESGAEAVLLVELSEFRTVGTYFPPTYHTRGIVSTEEDVALVDDISSTPPEDCFRPGGGRPAYVNLTTTQTGGGTVVSPVADYRIAVMDVGTGDRIWMADATTEGRADSSRDDMADSLAAEIVNELVKSHMLASEF